MKFWFGLALLALAIPNAHGEGIEIVSPNHAYTFAYGDAFSHQIERDRLTNEMIARIRFSNYPYAGDCEPRRDEMFDFVFPGLHSMPHKMNFSRARLIAGCAFQSRHYIQIFLIQVTSWSRPRKYFS